MLHKGQGKDRAHAKNYRTISTCPIVSKAIVAYISLLYSDLWNDATADTQFQRQESSHELAALALTESVNFSIASNSKPAYVIYLDAKSAFDLVLREILITDLYEIGIKDQGLVLIDERLKNRKTVCEWDRILMGPISDDCGVEQGGINSSEFYKVYNNDQLKLAQSSQFGIMIGPVTVSSMGQADDVALVADDLHALQGLLDLSLYFCKKKQISLNTAKTKLQVFSSKKLDDLSYFCKKTTEIKIGDDVIEFVDEAEHVGVVRSIHGNLPHLLSRITAHRKQMGSILPIGLAKVNRANPVAVLRAHQIYCLPVLFSGTAALVLKTSEIELIDQYLKNTLVNLQKLSPRTPPCVTYFLGGHMPATAVLHVKQLTLLVWSATRGILSCIRF